MYIHVDSRDRSSGTIENFNYQYTSRNVNYSEPYEVSIKSLEFPAGCIYQINSTNNVFRYQVNLAVVALNIDHGNYTINELLSILNADISATISSLAISGYTCTLSYNAVYNRIGILESGVNSGSNSVILLVSGPNNTNELLGLTSSITSTTTIQYLQNQVDLSPLDYVFLRCNQVYTDSFINGTQQANDILCKIQLQTQRNSKLYLNEQDLEENYISLPSLKSTFNFYITDKFGNIVSLNGVDYSFTLKLKKI